MEWISKTVRVLGRDSTPWTIHRRHCGRIVELGCNEATASRAVDKAPTQPFHRVRIAYIYDVNVDLRLNDINKLTWDKDVVPESTTQDTIHRQHSQIIGLSIGHRRGERRHIGYGAHLASKMELGQQLVWLCVADLPLVWVAIHLGYSIVVAKIACCLTRWLSLRSQQCTQEYAIQRRCMRWSCRTLIERLRDTFDQIERLVFVIS